MPGDPRGASGEHHRMGTGREPTPAAKVPVRIRGHTDQLRHHAGRGAGAVVKIDWKELSMKDKVYKAILGKGEDIESVSRHLGINRDTLSRHIKNQAAKMPVGEAREIAKKLDLTDEEILEAFFK